MKIRLLLLSDLCVEVGSGGGGRGIQAYQNSRCLIQELYSQGPRRKHDSHVLCPAQIGMVFCSSLTQKLSEHSAQIAK